MKTKIEKPLPCPFCGARPVFQFVPVQAAAELPSSTRPPAGPVWSLSCARAAQSCPAGVGIRGIRAHDKATAIAVWNTRHGGELTEVVRSLAGCTRALLPYAPKAARAATLDISYVERQLARAKDMIEPRRPRSETRGQSGRVLRPAATKRRALRS